MRRLRLVASGLSQGSWVRQAARDAGVPIYAVKTSSPSNLLRALRTLLGIDPSAGGTFARRPEEEEGGHSSRSESLAAAAADTAFVWEPQPPGPSKAPVHGNVVSRVRRSAGRPLALSLALATRNVGAYQRVFAHL